jgi:nitroimidazol reductase NimA-like FMN-containing flavoprotein (pyridoxamine 5'-phosphate oxidase superfamily)
MSPAGAVKEGVAMNEQEITAYLAAPHIAVVATIYRNGHPHLTPNWYRYDGKVLTLITRKDRLKYQWC